MNFSMRSLFLISFMGMIICGCSSNSSQPISPDNSDSSQGPTLSDARAANSSGPGHYLLHYGYIFVDPEHPDGPKVEVIPVRQGEFHLNVLKLLEIAPCDDCFRVVGFDFPEPDKLNIDILIEHPLDQLDYSVFDVRAIIMFNASHEFPMCGKKISDPALGDGVVLNPDGYTALYNGSTVTAPVGELQKYFPGILATPEVPDSDINGYKYFITDDPLNNRNAFYAGTSVVQSFSLQLPTGPFVIGYAVDVSRLPPISSPVDDPLTDFSIDANCTEPWKVVVTEEPVNGLTDYGGQTKLIVDVFDWQGKDTYHDPIVECPEVFDDVLTLKWVSDGFDYTRYEVSFSNYNKAPIGNYLCLVGVEAVENNPMETPWLDLTAYQFISLEVTEGETGGDLIWAKQAGGIGEDRCWDVTVLSDNSTVAIGWFHDSATFGQDEPNETILNSAGEEDIFIARYNPDGSLAWAKHAGGPFTDLCWGITALSDNSIVVTGWFSGLATFGQGEPNETVLTSGEYTDIFVARYNPDGSLEWAKQASGSYFDYSYGVTTLSDDSTVVTGLINSSTIFGEGEPNETVLNSAGSRDIFIAKYNPDGSLAWAKQAGGAAYDNGYGITTRSDDTLIVTGRFEGSATFGQGEPNETVLNSAGKADIFITRYNPDGSLAWAKSAGGPHSDFSFDVTMLSDNSFVLPGRFNYTATFGKGEPNETVLNSQLEGVIFIARYYPDGSLAWAKKADNDYHMFGYFSRGEDVTTLSDNSVVMTGYFGYKITFGENEPNETILEGGGFFIARYSPDGNLVWAKQGVGSNIDSGWGIITLSDNSIVVGGYFRGSATYGPGEPNETVLNSEGEADMFIARYVP